MKNKSTIFLTTIFIIGFLMLSGCQNQQKPGASFVGGTNGLLINFVEGNPPSYVYDSGSTNFNIIVELKNDGEHTIPKSQVEVRISGINPNEFGISPSDLVRNPSEDLEGVKLIGNNKVPGTTTQIQFPTMSYRGQVLADVQLPIRAEVCYTYSTKAISKICIKKDLSDTTSSVCKVREKKQVSSSGAPIQVTSFEQDQAGNNKTRFTFTIEQKGNGDVFEKDSKCYSSVSPYTIANKVYVKVDTKLPGLKCTGLVGGDTEGFVVLSGGKRTIECVQEVMTETDYNANVEIVLTYDFRNIKETTLTVRKQI
ncbi:MAG: hypothetical protein QXU20_04440 [Candidatus Woesearchaeota archaeon]